MNGIVGPFIVRVGLASMLGMLMIIDVKPVAAQNKPFIEQPRPYTIELYGSIGPMISAFGLRSRPTEIHVDEKSWGLSGIGRLLWHPNHRLAIGILSGHQLFRSENIKAQDSNSLRTINASLWGTPLMIDVSMQSGGLDWGIGLGGYLIRSRLDDEIVSDGYRYELGFLAHIGYRTVLFDRILAGPELAINYLNYRGILSLAPHFSVKYDLFRY